MGHQMHLARSRFKALELRRESTMAMISLGVISTKVIVRS